MRRPDGERGVFGKPGRDLMAKEEEPGKPGRDLMAKEEEPGAVVRRPDGIIYPCKIIENRIK